MQGTLKRVVRFMQTNAPPPGSFSELLQAVQDPLTNKPYTQKQLVPEAAALFSAASDTTAHTLTLAL